MAAAKPLLHAFLTSYVADAGLSHVNAIFEKSRGTDQTGTTVVSCDYSSQIFHRVSTVLLQPIKHIHPTSANCFTTKVCSRCSHESCSWLTILVERCATYIQSIHH